jgi:hypothetical protein
MKKRLYKDKKTTNSHRQLSSPSSGGLARKRKEILRPMRITTVRWDKISTSSRNGTREEKY